MPRKSATIDQSTDTDTQSMTTETAEQNKEIVRHEKLEGDELLAAIRALEAEKSPEDPEKEEVMRACGYYSETFIDGELTRVTYQENAFWSAFSAAQGIKLAAPTRSGSAGRAPSKYATVSKTGARIVVGGHFSEQAGFEIGQKLNVTVSNGQIVLTPMQGEEDL